MKTEDIAQGYDIHKTYTADNSFPLVSFYVDSTDTLHYGLAFHKWKEELKHNFMCIIDLGRKIQNVKETLLDLDDKFPNTDDLENGNIFENNVYIFKFYGRIWKPVERQVKKNEWKYKKLPVRNYVSRIIK